MKKKLVTGVVAVGLLLGGTTIVAASMNDNEGKPEATNFEVGKVNVEKSNGIISVSEAIDIALSEQDGYVDDVELETKRGVTYYEIDIESKNGDYDIYVDANTGEILKVDADDDNRKYKNKDQAEDVMSVEEASNLAISEFGGKVKEIELDKDDGRYEYEIELKTKHGEVELTLDAVTGEIIELDID